MSQTAPVQPVPPRSPDAPLALDYAPPRSFPRWTVRAIVRRVLDLGPLFPLPSVWSFVLVMMCPVATVWLAQRPEPWRLVRSVGLGQTNGSFSNAHHLPRTDSIASMNGDGSLRVWRPWADEPAVNMEIPAAALPPNPPPGRKGQVWWVTASADESKLLGKSELGTYLWDARSGKLLGELNGASLGPDGAKRPHLSLGGLSPDGTRLCVVNDADEVLLYDVSGPGAKLLAKRLLFQRPPPGPPPTTPMPPPPPPVDPIYHVRFTPDGRHILVQRNEPFNLVWGNKPFTWLGDAATLEPRLSWWPPYTQPQDVMFLRGGDRMLALFHGYGDAQEVRLYDLPTSRVLARWPAPDDPTALAVSPDEKRAFVGVSSQAAMILNLEGGGAGRVARRLPVADWLHSAPVVLPDNRRVVVSNLWHRRTGIIDIATGRHVANLGVPDDPGGRRVVPFAPDGRRLAVQTGTRLHVFEQVGKESAWGVFAESRFWLLALCVGLLAGSLWRDALRSRTRRGRHEKPPRRRVTLAAALVVCGGAALVCPFVWLTFGAWILGDPYTWWFDDGWLVWLFLLYLPAGLGLLAGSRLWTAFLFLLLPSSIGAALWLLPRTGWFAEQPERIFDRMWMLPPALVAALQLIWAAGALAGLLALAPALPVFNRPLPTASVARPTGVPA